LYSLDSSYQQEDDFFLKKALWVLNVDNYAPRIREITYPLLQAYAKKIGAEFFEITKRKYKEWPVVCEKMQIYSLAREAGAEWNIYFDADAMVHPETPDWTVYIPKDTVAQNANDFSNIRHRYDEYFLRDGRNIGTCGWCTIASEWCLDLWHPCEDLTPAEVVERCRLTVNETNSGTMNVGHLADDYIMSRNVARYGLKYVRLRDVGEKLFPAGFEFFWHAYTITEDEKVQQMKETLDRWKLWPDYHVSFEYKPGRSPMGVTGA
jgi:hypothetical protein